MLALKAICIAFSTYSVIPVPRFEWKEDAMRYSLGAFPLVGVSIGCALLLWFWVCDTLHCGNVIFAAVATALPLLVTGGIHMDGFCDTVDALASHQERERKLEILKDSNVGAFAVIYCILYLMICFGLYTEMTGIAAVGVVCIGFVFSRCLAALSAFTQNNARGSGMLMAFTENVQKRISAAATIVMMMACITGMLRINLSVGISCVMVCALWFYAYRRMAKRQFGGVTGDTTGFFLQVTELLILVGVYGGMLLETSLFL